MVVKQTPGGRWQRTDSCAELPIKKNGFPSAQSLGPTVTDKGNLIILLAREDVADPQWSLCEFLEMYIRHCWKSHLQDYLTQTLRCFPVGFVFCQDFFFLNVTSIKKKLTRSPKKKQIILLANYTRLCSGLGWLTRILLALAERANWGQVTWNY